MIITHRIRGGAPPNQGGRLVVFPHAKRAAWFDQDQPNGSYVDVQYDSIPELLLTFEQEGAIIQTSYHQQTWWERLKQRFGYA